MIKEVSRKYETYRDSGIEWIGDIPEHWEVKRLKETSNIQNSNVDKISHDHEIEVRLCNYVDVYKNEYVNSSLNFMQATADISEIRRFTVRKDDVLITKDSETCDDIAIPALATESLDGVLCGYHLAQIRTKNKVLLGSYLFRLFQSKSYGFRFVIFAKGITRVGLGQSAIADALTLLPSSKEQKAIIDYLDTKTVQIDQKIDLLTQKAKHYGQLKKSLINEAVTRGLDKTVVMKDSGIEWVGDVPKHWKLKRLKDIGISIIGLTYAPEDVLDNEANGILVLRSSNIQNGKLSLLDNVHVSKAINKRQILRKGDILICSRNGSRALIGKNICIDERTDGQTFGAFMTVYRSRYFRFISKYFNSNIFESQSGLFGSSTVNQLTINTLNNFLVFLPSSSEQKAIADYLDTKTAQIDTIVGTINTQLDKLKELRKTLINDVVTGKIKVVKEGQTA